jgi:Tol biopolymer transport system component/DNA-binding winged helix-turn-helix (wHTH) protein
LPGGIIRSLSVVDSLLRSGVSMATQSHSSTRYGFGPFEVNAGAEELLRSGNRVRLPRQPFQILLMLVAQPGELVTRDQLREHIWLDGTFVDFDHGLNAAMNKLRRALGDSAENPRYIETLPGRGYRFIGTLQGAEHGAICPDDVPPVVVEPTAWPGWWRWWWWLAGAAACLGSFVLGLRVRERQPMPPPWKLVRLTTDTGVSAAPVLSADSKLLAYSSDRGSEGEQDIYVKQVIGGQPIRLTTDGEGNTAPDFSPDGSKIVFQSNRDGGGIYIIPAFGGEARLLAKHGLNPRFSPDGAQVAYWVGAPNVSAAVPGGGAVWVVPVSGGAPRSLGQQTFTNARYPIWAPDGKHVLVVGYTSRKPYDSSALDWWLVSSDGGAALKAGLLESLSRSGWQSRDPAVPSKTLPNIPVPRCWLASGNRLVFSTQNGDAANLWETAISLQTGKVDGVFSRLTAGAETEADPSCASEDALVFTNVEEIPSMWLLPFDLDRVKTMGSLERITPDSSAQEHSSLSGDGRFLAYASARSGPLNIWLRDLKTGADSHVASSSLAQRYPVVDSSGSQVAFSTFENGNRQVYVSTSDGAEKVCEACFRATDWSRDDKTLIIFTGSPYQINTLDVASRQQTTLLKHPAYNLLYGRLSPDYRWISFTARVQPNRGIIMIAPLDGQTPVPESRWIKITEEGAEDWANWSPDGKTLYFTSARDGHTCLWAQRIAAVSHIPVGEALAVLHLHGRATYRQGGWSAKGGRIAMVLVDGTENIWMMSRLTSH